jgi:RNA polymerase sigma-70 factor (ECF subfamily)
MVAPDVTAPSGPPPDSGGSADVGSQVEPLRRELTAYCYQMLGSFFEAEDAAQETIVRAWRSGERFEGRSSVRTWAYRIATNVCIDMLRGRRRRAQPIELGPASPPDERFLGAFGPEWRWVTPAPDRAVVDPAEAAARREAVRLAFVTALQHLPARQRAAVLLADVLDWRASEIAQLLETTVAAVNSALQRGRATLRRVDTEGWRVDLDAPDAELLDRYVEAFERYDVDAFVSLLHEDAVQSMPPYEMWIRGSANMVRWMLGGGRACRGSRLVPVAANDAPAFGQDRRDPAGGYAAWALQVLEVADGRICHLHSFLDVDRLFPAFGLVPRLPGPTAEGPDAADPRP